jgi:hypothetical protein
MPTHGGRLWYAVMTTYPQTRATAKVSWGGWRTEATARTPRVLRSSGTMRLGYRHICCGVTPRRQAPVHKWQSIRGLHLWTPCWRNPGDWHYSRIGRIVVHSTTPRGLCTEIVAEAIQSTETRASMSNTGNVFEWSCRGHSLCPGDTFMKQRQWRCKALSYTR